MAAKRDVENAADARMPGDALEDALPASPRPKAGTGAVLADAMKKKARRPRRGQLGTPPSGFGQRVEGASTSTSRVGY
jgi:hypothetical protein